MGKDNEELKNDLRNGSRQFASAATTLQGIEDVIKQVMTDLSPTTKTWDGQASTASNEDLKELTQFTTTGKEVLQKTSDALISLVQAIEDAEKEAADEAKKADVANDLILVLGVVLLPVAAGAVGGALAAQEGASLLNKAIQLLRDADTKMAGVLDEARALVQKIPTLFTDIKTVDEIPVVDEVPPPAPAGEIPVEPPAPVQADTPPASTPEFDAPVETPEAPEAEPPS